MTGAEKYLRSLVDQNEYITNMIRRKEELIERSKTIKTVDTSVERVQTSHNTDRICDITTEIAALEQEIEEEDAHLELLKAKIFIDAETKEEIEQIEEEQRKKNNEKSKNLDSGWWHGAYTFS